MPRVYQARRPTAFAVEAASAGRLAAIELIPHDSDGKTPWLVLSLYPSVEPRSTDRIQAKREVLRLRCRSLERRSSRQGSKRSKEEYRRQIRDPEHCRASAPIRMAARAGGGRSAVARRHGTTSDD